MKNKKTLLIRIGAILVLVAIAAVMFVIGRGHTVYIDNKTLEVGEESYSYVNKVVVRVNGEQIAKLSKRERGMATCIGQGFDMELTVTREKGGDEEIIPVHLDLPYNMDGIIFNVPGYLAGLPADVYMTEFVQAVDPAGEEDEEIVTDEFALGDI